MTGYTLEDLNAMSEEEFLGLFHPNDQLLISNHMQEVVSSRLGEVSEIEYRFRRKNGEWMWCLSRDALFEVDEEGKATQFMGTFIDITKIKEKALALRAANKRLRQANREIEQFAYIASHDLQDPMRSILGFVELFKLEYRDALGEHGEEYLSNIKECTHRMQALTQGLLEHSRIGQNAQNERLSCNALLEAVLLDMQAKIKETGAEVVVEELPEVEGVETELRLLFQNLISNAIKFVAPGTQPKVVIKAKPGNKKHLFIVKDNGVGIAPEHQKEIFKMFKRLHNRSEYQGTGIGLAHCFKVVKNHGGFIWVESEVEAGSSFFFTLPSPPATNHDGMVRGRLSSDPEVREV